MSSSLREGARISIVIPCFNREKFVGEAIQSAMQQETIGEIIVVDDGSIDDSWNRIRSFPNVVGISSPNRGPSSARNIGVEAAKHEYIQFLDADDILPPRSSATLLSASQGLGPGEIAFGTVGLHEQDCGPDMSGYGYADLGPGVLSGRDLLSRVMPCVLPLFPTEALRQTGGFNEQLRIGEDYELAARLHCLGYRFVQTDGVTYRVRNHGGPRLTSGLGERDFRYRRQAFELASSNLLSLEGSEGVASEERKAMARLIWIVGREAARACVRSEAEALFALASNLGGHEARVGNAVVRSLYKVLKPYVAERAVERLKAVSEPRRKVH